ncbi:hypothetical protein HS088_TW13G01428 [Tripterygium wilfordii]|uniref:Uncharacterized protein n=1 Tax=Tripterygium wilfordii TaxID=458696 RepID=A0A7J7CWY7_TRIWF|nr:hypothetical protein HS088_TW13G01428 [Tripterygium wilfordii]
MTMRPTPRTDFARQGAEDSQERRRFVPTTMHVAIIAAASTAGEEPVLELYVHDILGGSSATARPVTGLLGNIYNGQVPLCQAIGISSTKRWSSHP